MSKDDRYKDLHLDMKAARSVGVQGRWWNLSFITPLRTEAAI
jgi:hypothetical protein